MGQQSVPTPHEHLRRLHDGESPTTSQLSGTKLTPLMGNVLNGPASNDNTEGGGSPAPAAPAVPPPDRAMAEAYITALTGSPDTKVTFQTFVDDKTRGPSPAYVRHGTLAEHWDMLVQLNVEQGHGIYVMVNAGDLKERKAENVTALRALFIDDDGKGPQPVAFAGEGQPPFAALPPSITVQSKHGQHNYFLLHPGEPLDGFTPGQVGLASHFGTDATVKDLPRVMRVPGFRHLKDRKAPFVVRLVQAAPERRYTLHQLAEAYPAKEMDRFPTNSPTAKAKVTKAKLASVPAPTMAKAEVLRQAATFLAGCAPAVEGQSGDKVTFAVCCSVARGFNLTDEEAMEVLRPWNATCSPPWAEDALLQKVHNARQHGTEEIGGRIRAPGAATPADFWKTFGDAKCLQYCIPLLNERFALYREPNGTERIFSVNARREVSLLIEEAPLKQALHDHLKATFQQVPPERVLTASILLWKKECPKMAAEPEPFCFAGDERLTFKRFDWVPSQGEYAAWKEFLGRLSDPDAFMAFVWSCFEPDNRSRQYFWLRGDGQDGKSVVLGVLHDTFGQAATAISNAAIREPRFLFSAIYGKRLVVYPDCKDTKLGMREVVRNLTAGDPVPVEFKGKTPFTASMRAKLFVASNPKPEVTGQAADQSRMIYIEVAPTQSKDDPSWRSRLEAELPHFLWACREVYGRLCPKGGDIQLNDASRELQSLAAAAFEQRFYDLFEARFAAEPGAKAVAAIVSDVLRNHGINNQEAADFKAWMERTHGVTFGRTKSERFYTGLRVKTASELTSSSRLPGLG